MSDCTYHEIVLPFFTLKHGQVAAVAITRSGANKILKKVWEAFITRRDRILSREHAKSVQSQRKFDTQLQTAQLSAGQQIDNRIDQNLAGLDAKVKSIIKETVKSQYIKKESIAYDKTLFEDENIYHENSTNLHLVSNAARLLLLQKGPGNRKQLI